MENLPQRVNTNAGAMCCQGFAFAADHAAEIWVHASAIAPTTVAAPRTSRCPSHAVSNPFELAFLDTTCYREYRFRFSETYLPIEFGDATSEGLDFVAVYPPLEIQ